MNGRLAWYLSRSSGWVAFVLLALTVVWGVLGISRIIERRGLPRWLLDLHRHLAVLTVALTAVHLGALVADNWLHVAWREVFVPRAISYRPGAVTWGVVAMYLLIVVQVSSWCRSRLPRPWWRGLHLLSYPAVWLVAVHGVQAGTDASNRVVRYGLVVVVGAVAFFTLLRVLGAGERSRRTVVPDVPASS
jgi:DMSO/TMAO reductase YedYZ heme-binding membrane subunit